MGWSGGSVGGVAEDGGPQVDWGDAAAEWVEAGASLVGGCCRVTAADITDMRARVVGGIGLVTRVVPSPSRD